MRVPRGSLSSTGLGSQRGIGVPRAPLRSPWVRGIFQERGATGALLLAQGILRDKAPSVPHEHASPRVPGPPAKPLGHTRPRGALLGASQGGSLQQRVLPPTSTRLSYVNNPAPNPLRAAKSWV